MLDPFILRALFAAIGVALIAGVMGCFVVWRRMAYFGDSLAHSALLGVALGLISGLGSNIGILIICILFASLLLFLQQKKLLATDTLLGILAHAGLSIAVVVISLANIRINLHGYLFGDILTVTFYRIGMDLWRWHGCIMLADMAVVGAGIDDHQRRFSPCRTDKCVFQSSVIADIDERGGGNFYPHHWHFTDDLYADYPRRNRTAICKHADNDGNHGGSFLAC